MGKKKKHCQSVEKIVSQAIWQLCRCCDNASSGPRLATGSDLRVCRSTAGQLPKYCRTTFRQLPDKWHCCQAMTVKWR